MVSFFVSSDQLKNKHLIMHKLGGNADWIQEKEDGRWVKAKDTKKNKAKKG